MFQGQMNVSIAHLDRFFHLAKNDSPFMSVGSKNLLMDSGSRRVRRWGTDPYVNDKLISGSSGGYIQIM